MPRIRYLKPDFFTDEELAELSPIHRLAFAGIWCYADKSGRLEYRPMFLKAMIFPYEKVDMDKILADLYECKAPREGFIQIYCVDDRKYIQISNWGKHQKPHHTEKESEIPDPPECDGTVMEKGMEKGMEKQLKASSGLDNGSLTVKKSKEQELKGYLLTNIPEDQKKLQNKIVEFFEYRMQKKKKDRYQTKKGIDGLLKDMSGCIACGFNVSDCFDTAMAREWKTIDPSYFEKLQIKQHPQQAPKVLSGDEIERMNAQNG